MSTPATAARATAASEAEVDRHLAYQELLPRVFHYFCLRTGDRAQAEDLTAATFERAWRDRQRYQRDLAPFSRWVFGIARHVAIDYYRERSQPKAPIQAQQLQSPRPTEEAAAQYRQFELLSALLAGLPHREREIISLKYGGRLTNRSIASVMRLSETNVGTIVHRVVTQLRAHLVEEP